MISPQLICLAFPSIFLDALASLDFKLSVSGSGMFLQLAHLWVFQIFLFKFQALLVANVNNFANLRLSCLLPGLFSPNIGSGLSLFADCVQNSGFNG